MFRNSKPPQMIFLWNGDSKVRAISKALSKVNMVENTADITFIAWKFLKPISSSSALFVDWNLLKLLMIV